MEETRFDHVARALAAPRDRRGLISLLAGAVASAAADLVFEELLAAGLFEGLFLEVEVLVLGGDAGVADVHGVLTLQS